MNHPKFISFLTSPTDSIANNNKRSYPSNTIFGKRLEYMHTFKGQGNHINNHILFFRQVALLRGGLQQQGKGMGVVEHLLLLLFLCIFFD